MKHRFLIDAHLPPSFVSFFEERGYDATHVIDYPSGVFTDDNKFMSIALKEDRIIVTKDMFFVDFFHLKGYPRAVLLLHFGNTSNKDLLRYLGNNFERIIQQFRENSQCLLLMNQTKIVTY